MDKIIAEFAKALAGGQWRALRESCNSLHREAATEYTLALKDKQYADAGTWLARADAIQYTRNLVNTVEEDCWWGDTDE